MEPQTPQQKLVQVALRLQRVAVPLAQTYMARQAALGLARVLTEERLSSLAGIDASLATLDELEALDAWHRAGWAHWMVEATRLYTAVLAEFPEPRRALESAPLMGSLQREMQARHRENAARDDWLDAARRVCVLARRGREVDADTPGIVLADDEDIAEFERQLARADAAAALQQAQFEQRAARIQAGMDRLGAH
jgi:hypothetical protein